MDTAEYPQAYCATCRFFNDLGECCQRFPPHGFLDERNWRSAYPPVDPSSTCGEHRPRPTPVVFPPEPTEADASIPF